MVRNLAVDGRQHDAEEPPKALVELLAIELGLGLHHHSGRRLLQRVHLN